MKLRPSGIKLISSFQDAAALLWRGGLLLYPTETYYAIGCMANNNEAVQLIYKIKGRPAGKPLPVIAADFAQAALCASLSGAPQRLLNIFWPGPLTVVLPALASVAPALLGGDNRVALRVSSSPVASLIASLCGFPLSASSANLSGRQPVQKIIALDSQLLSALQITNTDFGILAREDAESHSSLPSTIVEPQRDIHGCWKLRILRHGAISRSLLERENFEIIN